MNEIIEEDNVIESKFRIYSMARPWSEIKDKMESHLGEMILHLVKIYYYHDFEEYLRGWIDSVRKGFDNIPKRANNNRLPTKEDVFNYLWIEELSEDPDGLLRGDIEDINYVYTDVPEIPIENIDYEGFSKFLKSYIEILSDSISKNGNISINLITQFVKNYDYGFSLKQ